MSRTGPTWLLMVLLGCLSSFSNTALGYEAALHQKLTFVAAKQFNRCVNSSLVPALSPLQVRYIARANAAQAQVNIFVRMFRWGYYDRSARDSRSFLWLIDTRFSEHFNELTQRIDRKRRGRDDEARRYSDLGRIIGYMQDVTSPARTVPVYIPRFWRLSWSDRFDGYPVDEQSLNEATSNLCEQALADEADYKTVLAETAEQTLSAVRSPIFGMPTTWEAFWKPSAEADEFGEYGPAGNNFGRQTQFRCGDRKRCVLLADDPLYREFALQRHVDAVAATMRAMWISQVGSRAPGE